MDLHTKSRKEVGNIGEKVAALYLQRHGHRIVTTNYARKTGEIDIITQEGSLLHFVEVKTLAVDELPVPRQQSDVYDPSVNLHESKIRKVARTGEWYALETDWEGDVQVDAVLVWIRRCDGKARVHYLPQII
jgi:putative endonuclease